MRLGSGFEVVFNEVSFDRMGGSSCEMTVLPLDEASSRRKIESSLVQFRYVNEMKEDPPAPERLFLAADIPTETPLIRLLTADPAILDSFRSSRELATRGPEEKNHGHHPKL